MSGPHPDSDAVRGVGARAVARSLAWGGGYAALTALGCLGLLVTSSDRLRAGAWLPFVLIAVIGVAGLSLGAHDAWFVRHRPRVGLGVAPSGQPAVVVPRSSFQSIGSVVVTAVLLAVFVAAAIAFAADHPVGAVFCAVVAVLLAWPLVAAARGRIRVGGLYLTALGLEHRRDAVTWSVRWEQVAAAAPRDPVGIVLQPGERAETTRTTRWTWNREVAAPEGTLGISCRALALDGVLVAAAVNTAIAFPDRRVELGTAAALGWEMFARES